MLARGPHGETVIANFPVYVGVDAPTSLSLEAEEETTGGSADVASVRAELLRLANETRAEVGLPPYTCEDRIDAVALAHSTDMAEHDFVLMNRVADAWIGANDLGVEGTWRWINDGVPFWRGLSTGGAVLSQFARWGGGRRRSCGSAAGSAATATAIRT